MICSPRMSREDGREARRQEWRAVVTKAMADIDVAMHFVAGF